MKILELQKENLKQLFLVGPFFFLLEIKSVIIIIFIEINCYCIT